MIGRVHVPLLVAGAIAASAIAPSEAASVKNIILEEVDPGGTNGTVVSYYAELTPEQQAEFASNYDDGQGYYISPVATVSRTAGGMHYTETTSIFIVPLGAGSVVVPISVTCSHSGCSQGCTVTGCSATSVDNKPACTGASCSGKGCGAQNPSCSKTESTAKSSFLVFGSV